jgi:hypothetical protein
MEQIHIGHNELCIKVGGSKNIVNKHNYSDNRIHCILTWFGYPLILVTYQGIHFINDDIMYMIKHFLLKHTNSTIYYL